VIVAPAMRARVGGARRTRRAALVVAAAALIAACHPTAPATGNSGGAGGSGGTGGSGGAGGGGGVGGSGVDAAVPTDGAATDGSTVDGGDPRAPVLSLLEKVADWQIAQYGAKNPEGWIDGTFYAGLMATWRTTQAQRFLDRARAWANANQWTMGGDQSPDWECAGQSFVELYQLDSVAAHLAPTQQVVDGVVAAAQPGRKVWSWIDALFMAPPGFARVGEVSGQAKYFDTLSTMWWDVVAALFDSSSSLFFRDASYIGKTCANGQKMFWARGNGWVMAGLVRVLEKLPASHPDRPKFVMLLQTMATKVATLQKPDGFWPSCLTDAQDYAEPETSGTSAFVFALAWGINHGLLASADYLPIVRSGWKALVGAVDASGRLGWVQPVGAAPGPSKMTDTQPYGVGLFLLAGTEVAALAGQL
jgi:rhamnogalacturonyl hydrolase YesR